MNALALPVSDSWNLANIATKLQGTSKTTASSSGTSNALVTTFNEILEEAITGATKLAAQAASNRAAEFVEDRDQLRALAQAAGWAPTSSSSSSSSSSSNDPVYRLVMAFGQTLLDALEVDEQDTSGSTSTQTSDQSNDTSSTSTEESS